MAYRELAAHRLPPHVACLWRRDPQHAGTAARILPDACVDVVWVRGGRLSVAGPATAAVLARVPAGATVAGVRFRVGAAGSALGLPAAALLDQTVAVEDLWGRAAAEAIAQHVEAAAPGDEPAALAAALAQRRPTAAPDRLVRAAAASIAAPGARVDEVGRALGVSDRQLRRRFAEAVGYGPKVLQRILRFQRFLALAGEEPGADLARLALEAGYADQPHLTRECGRLSGLPPSALLATGAGPAGERSDLFKTRAPAAASMAA